MPQFFYDPESNEVVDIALDGASVGEMTGLDLDGLRTSYREVQLLPASEVHAAIAARDVTTPAPTTLRELETALCALPPKHWCTKGGMSFQMTEHYRGPVTCVYVRLPDGSCWTWRDIAGTAHAALIAKATAAAGATATATA
ncbi:hypothetical protein E4T66_18525 [Sinimarinibacterium sp. CAU 1509]|uniref:hypothetical protein n=1 Tax=Sinimarinibacterium sp. CAU 1509 TaxID=2562283 RepID=UPI0010AD97A7|nr:hypothetical protein [Sinimarinibacterium sp. CAU 1509]TJY57403.1 hypothetical protein E4T66_18525 [Sinimarinibacterium sp. CAU 1509]